MAFFLGLAVLSPRGAAQVVVEKPSEADSTIVPTGPVPTAIPSPPSLREEARPMKKREGRATAIRPRFLPGNTYRFVTRTELRTSLGGTGNVVVEQQVRLDGGVRVDGKEGVAMKARSERLDVEMRSGGRTITYHSLKPEDRTTLVGRHFEAALHRSVDFNLNENLRVASAVEGGREGLATPLPGLPRFGPEELKQLMETIPQGFPAKAVYSGDTWTREGVRSVGSVGSLTFEVTYQFIGPVVFEENQCLGIEFAGRIQGKVPLPTSGDDAAAGGFAELGSQSMSGRLLFDPLDEMLRFSEQHISLQLAIPGPEGSEPQLVPVEETTTIRLLHVVPTA
ncbi:MAG: hypothetical protein GXX91_09165 [Verrucomicrobiaceae bacterium]|nr:hypothetical protein [Verrucomicrobiaceae bacterium]